MNDRVLKLFNVGSHEMMRVVYCAALLFFITFGIEIGRMARDSFFLKMAGPDQIPYMYVIVGFLMGGASFFYSRFIAWIRSDTIFNLFLFGGGLLLVVDWWVTRLGVAFFKWIPYVNFCVLEIFIMLLLIHFWNHISELFDSREGKRIFPLIGGAGLIGTMGGGLFTHQLSKYIGTVNLLLVWTVFLMISAGVLHLLNRSESPTHVTPDSSGDQKSRDSFLTVVKNVWKLPLMRIMTYMALPMWIIIYVIEFHYFKLLNQVFPNIDQLTSFMGFFVMLTSCVGMFIQIGLTPRLLNWLGVGGASVLYPFSLTLGAISLMFFNLFPQEVQAVHELKGHMWLIPLARFCDVAIYFSIYESATQLAFYAVTPKERSQGRAFMSGIVIPISIALSGLLLIFLERLNEPMHNLSFVALNLSFMLLIFSLSVGTTYMRALVQNLHGNQEKQTLGNLNSAISDQNSEMRFVLLQAISSKNQKEAMYAFQNLIVQPDPELLDEFVEVLDKSIASIQISILEFIVNHKHWVSDREQYKRILMAMLLNSASADVNQKILRTFRQLNLDFSENEWSDVKQQLSDVSLQLECDLLELKMVKSLRSKIEILKPYYVMATTSHDGLVAYLYIQRELKLKSFVSSVLKLLAHFKEEDIPSCVFLYCRSFSDKQLGETLVYFLDSFLLRRAVSECLLAWFKRDPLFFGYVINGSFPDHLKRKCILIYKQCLDITLLTGVAPVYMDHLSDHPLEWIEVFWFFHNYFENNPEKNEEWQEDVLDKILPHVEKACEVLYAELGQLNINVFFTAKLESAGDIILQNHARKMVSGLIQCLGLISNSNVVSVLEQSLSKRWVYDPDQMEILEGSCVQAKKLVAMLETCNQSKRLHVSGQEHFLINRLNLLLPDEIFWLGLGRASNDKKLPLTHWIHIYRKGSYEWGHCLERLKLENEGEYNTYFDGEAYAMYKNLTSIMNTLKGFSWFESMNLSDLQWVSKNITEEHFDSQSLIFNENEKGTKAYFIKSGEVVITKNSEEGCLVLKRYREGELFGEIACLTELNRTGSAKAVTAVDLYSVSKAVLIGMIKSDANFALKLCEVLAEKVENTNIMTGKAFMANS